MDFDDPFSEPVASKAPTTSRFQPKAKLRPKKAPHAVVKDTKKPSVKSLPQDPLSDQAVQHQPNDNVEKVSDYPVSSPMKVTESLAHGLEDGSTLVENKEVTGLAGIQSMEFASSDINGKDLGVDTLKESQLPTDVDHLSTTTADCPPESPMPDASNVQSEEDLSDSGNSPIAHGESIDKTFQDSECFKESLVCGDGDFQIDVEQLGDEDFSNLDTMHTTNEASGKRAAKYKPKPKVRSDRQKDSAAGLGMSVDGNKSVDPSVDQPDNVVSEDIESLSPENQQQSEENLREKESSDELDSSAKSIAEGIVPEFEVNESGPHENSSLNDRVHGESTLNSDENNEGDHLVEKSPKKKRPRKSKKTTLENDKPARKRRKKEAKEPDEAIVKPPKKFPRGTRRKRCVEQSLLEAPEEELDLQRVPIRDLIILAEYKERQAKKQAATTAAVPSTNESNGNTLTEDPLYDDNGSFGFDQDGDPFDNPSTSEGVTKDTGYFNYHTYMKKEPRAKWTKHDTELFYKGISQFGSDLSMIQQLFPGRTRNQIKLKYKKEERQNPMRLNDALTNRAQDLSHFELVITRLQEQAAQEAKSDREDSGDPVGKDEEGTEVNTNNKNVANSEQNEESSVAEQEAAKQEASKQEVESPSKSYYSEDDEIDWNAYKSDL